MTENLEQLEKKIGSDRLEIMTEMRYLESVERICKRRHRVLYKKLKENYAEDEKIYQQKVKKYGLIYEK